MINEIKKNKAYNINELIELKHRSNGGKYYIHKNSHQVELMREGLDFTVVCNSMRKIDSQLYSKKEHRFKSSNIQAKGISDVIITPKFKANDVVVCIKPTGKSLVEGSFYIVEWVNRGLVLLNGYDNYFCQDRFELYADNQEQEIKGIEKMMDENKTVEREVKDPTFNDLIDNAVVAYKDGVLEFFEVGSDGTSRYILATHNEKDLLFHDGDSSYSHAVEYIISLYNETFMIESEDDIERVSIGATIELLNGNKDKVMHTDKYSKQAMIQFTENKHWGAVGLFILKGATVTQQKGNK